jgi:hypothetical protein
LIFSRKKDHWKQLEEEVDRLRKEINELQRKRAEINDLGRKAAAGLLTPETITAGTPGEKLEELRRLTVLKNYFTFQMKLRQLENQIDQEINGLQEKVAEMEQKLSESPSLNIIEPQRNTVAQGTLYIQWSSTGIIGDKLRVFLLKKGIQFRIISVGISTAPGCLEWRIPREVPPGTDYQVALVDPVTGLTAVSEQFKIRPQ